MSRIAVSGANGFLGWHTRCAIEGLGHSSAAFRVGDGFSPTAAASAIDGASRLVHLAGVNRGSDAEVHDENERFARQVAEALRLAEEPPPVVVFANSIQAELGNVYGEAKRRSAGIIAAACEAVGVEFVDVRLPNLFGEHGRPFYNSFVATFSDLLARGGTPVVEGDREVPLLHAQAAAAALLGTGSIDDHLVPMRVSSVLADLSRFARDYAHGTIPALESSFQRDLFNTYRSFDFGIRQMIPLTRHADARGSFFEITRSVGGAGQSSFSTTRPGVTRGDHYHARKIERFTVVRGTAVIRLQRLFSDDIVQLHVSGDEPVAVDMPTFWSHNITNTGADDLYTNFWINEIYVPEDPDTYPKAIPV
ncbi:NAD-dependent epimerase/dehydratase family protein [Agromyces aureus]|uniref:Capsular biosynthesis protein n=2 Tax=Agromyces aureus TaxID=453304 RepID=A0A191WHL9_9MICO|nr:NAD-dependent epimerase/dehydratase family protein [Agromyces aureus]ANJ27673.1 capsular biosynthesis protein [Agromyces aureus]